MEGAEYRKALSQDLKQRSTVDRREALGDAKNSREYWDARTQKLKAVQEPTEISIDNGRGVLIQRKHLFHGSAIPGTRVFLPAEDTTVGPGVYLTSGSNEAIGYAEVRSETSHAEGVDPEPVLYEVSVENLRLLDLRREKVVNDISRELDAYMQDIRAKQFHDMPWDEQGAFLQVMERLALPPGSGYDVAVGKIKYIAQNGPWFTDYVKSLGYDGIITLEGGEASMSATTGPHDTYLIYDPSKVHVVREQ